MARVDGDGSAGVGPVGPPDQRCGAFARRYPGGSAARLQLDPAFRRSLTGQVGLHIIYLDDIAAGKSPHGEVRLATPGGATPVGELRAGGTGRWQMAELTVSAEALQQAPAEWQLEIRAGERPLVLHLVEVLRSNSTGRAASPAPSLLAALHSPILFKGDNHTAYRDPLLIYEQGGFHLFYSYVREEEDHLIYWYTAVSQSTDLRRWTKPRILTPKDQNLNYASPGNVVQVDGEWLFCLQTYVMVFHASGPGKVRTELQENANAHLGIAWSDDLKTWDWPGKGGTYSAP